MQAIAGARKKLFSNKKNCPVEVNGPVCRQSSLPETPSSAGASVGSQSELASPDFGFEFLDYPDGFDVFERHSSFDANLFELRRQAPEQIAAQLTLLNLAAFKKIMPKELHNGNWMKKQKAKLAPNLLAFTRQFNHICFWVEREVLEERSLKLRCDLVGFFIRVAKKLLDLDNFHGMMAVVSALQSAPVHRLNLTWKSLPKKDRQLHEKLVELASSDSNHMRLREQMNALRMPCIPHLALYLTDLAFLTTRQSSAKDPQIQTKIDAIVNTVVYFQNSSYEQLSHHKCIQHYLQSIDFIDELQSLIEREFFQKSKELEPDTCVGLRPYRSSELLDQERTPSSPPEVRSPSLIKAQCADRLVRRNHSWSTQHGQGEGVRGEDPLCYHTRPASASPTHAASSLVDSQKGVDVQVIEASPEIQRRGFASSLSASLTVGTEDVKGFEGSLPSQGTRKTTGRLSPLASRTVSLSFGQKRGHRKSSSVGSTLTQSTGIFGKSQTRSGSNSSGGNGMTSSISLLDDSFLSAPSPACSGSESSDDEDSESPSMVGFSRLSEEDFAQWQEQGSLKEGVLKRQLLRTGGGPVSRSLQKKVKCTVHLTESSLIMVKGKLKQPAKAMLLQAAAVLLLRDCYVSFAESTGKSSDKKQFIIADETGFAVRFVSNSVQDAEGWVRVLRGTIEDYNRKLSETSLIKL